MKKINIVLAEDDKDIRMQLCDKLKDAGCNVITAENGKVALDTILTAKKRRFFYDLLITDIKMPKLTGMELINELERSNIFIPVIAMTGFGDKELVIELLQRGCKDYIDKPFNPAELVKKVSNLIKREERLLAILEQCLDKEEHDNALLSKKTHKVVRNNIEITIRQINGYKVIDIRGEIIKDSASIIKNRVMDIIKKGIYSLIINLTEVNYINDYGIGIIVFLWKQVREKNGRFFLITGGSYIKEKIEEINLEKVIKIFDNEDEFQKNILNKNQLNLPL